VFYPVRSERMLMEQMQYNLLFRWFVGLAMDTPSSRRTATGCSSTKSWNRSLLKSWLWRTSRACCPGSTFRWTAR
jgi:transposase